MTNTQLDIPHPGWPKVFIRLMKLRVIVLLQITAICAILVHDLLARHGLIDVTRTWEDTFYASLITVIGGTLSAGGSNAINMWFDADIDQHMREGHKTGQCQWGTYLQQGHYCLDLLLQYWVPHYSSW